MKEKKRGGEVLDSRPETPDHFLTRIYLFDIEDNNLRQVSSVRFGA